MKRFSIRYSNLGINTLIILILLVSNFVIFKTNNLPEIFNFDSKEEFLSNIIDEKIFNAHSSGLFDDGYTDTGRENYLNFYFDKRVINNYEFTKFFKEKYGDQLVVKYNDGTISHYDPLEARDLDLNNKNILKTNRTLEEPIYVNRISTNVDLFKNLDNANLEDYKNQISNPYIYVKFENNEFEIQENNTENISKNQLKVLNQLRNYDNRFEMDINSDIEYEAIYEITPKVDILDKIVEYNYGIANILSNLFFVILGIMFIFIVISSITNYFKAQEIGYYKFIESVPIEIYSLLIFIALVTINGVFPSLIDFINYNNIVIENSTLYLTIAINVSIYFCILLIYYVVFGFKSIYHLGLRNFIFENSIIVRLFKFIFNTIKIVFNKISYLFFRYDRILKFKILIAFFLIFIVSFIALGLNILLYIFLVLVIAFFILNKWINDLSEIETSLNKVSNGDFNTKLENRNNYFRDLSKIVDNIRDSLNIAVERELKSERTKTELITNVSHDLKTPLTSIINYSDLATNRDITDEEREKYLNIINEKSLKLKVLIENLFEVSKVSSKSIEINKVEININQILTQMIGEWNDELENKNIEVIFNTNQENVTLELDGEHTSRIFDNLFSNISKYAQEYSRVYVDVRENSESISIIIKNISKYELNISPDELKERFTRGDESRNTDGSGLGLAIASSLVEIQGGNFDIDIDGDLFKITIVFDK